MAKIDPKLIDEVNEKFKEIINIDTLAQTIKIRALTNEAIDTLKLSFETVILALRKADMFDDHEFIQKSFVRVAEIINESTNDMLDVVKED